MKNKPIGVFDSGIGGLTVTKEILRVLPNESLIYLGDTARVPYGTRGKEVITRFALELTNFLLDRDVKFLVVACNTVSATCLDVVEKASPVPVLGVVKPAAREAVRLTNKIGVIGTRATVGSGVYEQEIKKLNPQAEVLSVACPLFVPLAEEGLADHPATRLIAEQYLAGFVGKDIDALILGCTHYPLLREMIQETVGGSVTLIDSARPTAEELEKILRTRGLLNSGTSVKREFFVTDAPERVHEAANFFFGDHLIKDLKKVKLNYKSKQN
jgi:glutamate racemase